MQLDWRRREPETETEAAPAEPQPQRSWRRRVLIVEDDPELWPALERFSAQAQPGVEVSFAKSRLEAEERLAGDTRFDVVLTDYCLPRPGGGKAIIESATTLQPWARVGMISALMGYQPTEDVPFLAKPFTSQRFRRFLRDLLGWRNPAA